MERDFLGKLSLMQSEPAPAGKDDGRGTVFYGNPAVQWSHVSRPVFQPVSITNTFDSNQRSFGLNGTSVFPVCYGNGFPNNVKQMPFGVGPTMSCPANSSTVGFYAPRDVPKPSTRAQLTIFYGGLVNVFYNVSPEKAQEILTIASKSSSAAPNPTPPTVNQTKSNPSFADNSLLLNPKHTTLITKRQDQLSSPPPSSLSVSISIAPPTPQASKDGPASRPHASVSQAKSVPAPPVLSSATTPPTLVSRAVPQARKASLARFLEKRKERVTSVMPYLCTTKSTDNGTGTESGNFQTNSSSTDITFSYSGESLSTKLEI